MFRHLTVIFLHLFCINWMGINSKLSILHSNHNGIQLDTRNVAIVLFKIRLTSAMFSKNIKQSFESTKNPLR